VILNSMLVGIGGFFGAMSRYGMSKWVNQRFTSVFPYGTLVVNLIGAFLLGLIIGHGWTSSWELLFGTGFMGAFTTFSTFKLETIQLHVKKEWNVLVAYLAISYTAGILLAFLGMVLGSTAR
jgi:CrcB protein